MALLAVANEPYADGGALVRVALPTSGEVIVAAHHAVLDGLGLVAVLGLVLGADLGTTARGVGAAARRVSVLRRLAYPAVRMGEAAFRPPARIAHRPGTEERGDRLVATSIGGAVSTSGLVAAAAEAVQRWNSTAGSPASRVVVAVGASLRPGRPLAIGRAAAWFRVEVAPGMTVEGVRRAMQERGPEPPPATAALRAARASGLAARMERRTGSTLLVSNLGGVLPEGVVMGAEFYPSAHGRSGFAVGAVRADAGTTLTARARRSDFTEEEATRFLALVAECAASACRDPDGTS
jgi:hypothetical protein